MAEKAEIERIARDVVNAQTQTNAVVAVLSEPSIDWTGGPILRIRIVLRPEAGSALEGETPLNILTKLSEQLMGIGEDRFPVIDYATTADLEGANDASES